MKKLIVAALVCLGTAAAAQTTTITGTVKDLTQTTVTSGRITFTLRQGVGVANIAGTGAFVSSTVSCLISQSGNPVSSVDGVSPCTITSNTSLTPTGTYYQMCIQPQFVTPGSCMNTTLVGGSVDISTIVPTPATQPNYPPPSGPASLSFAGTDPNGRFQAAPYTPVNKAGDTMTGALTTPSVNGELDGSSSHYSSAAGAVAAACGSANPAVHFPAGTYVLNATTGGMQACRGLHIRCDTKSIYGTSRGSGAIFQLAPGAAIWGLYNPNADIATGGDVNGTEDVVVDGCTFDISQDPQALGAIRVKGMSGFQMRGVDIVSNNNPNPAITLDGAQYAYNNGDYNGEFYSLNMQDLSGASSAIGVLITDGQSTPNGSCSNDDKFIGGSSSGYKYPFKIDCGNNNVIAWMDLENWASGGIAVWLTTQSVGGGAATGNHLISDRMESPISGVTGIQKDSGTYDNTVDSPYFSGVFTPIVDGTSSNPCHLCQFGGSATPNIPYQTLINIDSAHGVAAHGLNISPAQVDEVLYQEFGYPTGTPRAGMAVNAGNLFVGLGASLLDGLYVGQAGSNLYTLSPAPTAGLITGPSIRYNTANGFLYVNAGTLYGPTTLELNADTNGPVTTGTGLFTAAGGVAAPSSTLNSGHTFTRHTTISAALTPAAVAANTCATQALTVTGIQAGDIIINGLGVKPSYQAGLSVNWVVSSGANTVDIGYCNATASPITPASETYTFDVEQ